MKKTMLALATLALLSSSAFATEVLKRCEVTFPQMDEDTTELNSEFTIIKRDGKISATFTQNLGGLPQTMETTAVLNTFDIKEGLKAGLSYEEIETLNPGEVLIAHAMEFEADEEMNSIFNTGIADISKVRKVNTYLVDEATDMGSTTIVEAFDQEGNNLGSFLGGFLVRPCKE